MAQLELVNISLGNNLEHFGRAITWIIAELFSIGPLETRISGILIEILTFSFTKMDLKILPENFQPFCQVASKNSVVQ